VLITWGCKTTLCSVWSDVLVFRCCWIIERIFVLLSLLFFTVQAYLIVVHWQATCELHMQHQSTCCLHILVSCIVASQPFNIIMNYVSTHIWINSCMKIVWDNYIQRSRHSYRDSTTFACSAACVVSR
jgi:hypothetical protein